MIPDTLNTSIEAKGEPKKRIWSLVAAHFIGAGFDAGECEPIGEREFKLLMGLVVLATSAFGFIMHG
jgi:hypothetical protein